MGMTSSMTASLVPWASPSSALSATLRQASMVPRTARQTASLGGARLGACPALNQHKRLLPLALVSPQQQLTHARISQTEGETAKSTLPEGKICSRFHFGVNSRLWKLARD